MKFAKIAAVALISLAPVAASAQQADPFVATAGLEQEAMMLIFATAGVIGIVAASGTN